MFNVSEPEVFYKRSGSLIKPVLFLAFVLAAVGIYSAFFICKVDAVQGESYRIIYLHIGAAWMSLMLYVVMALFAARSFLATSRMSAMLMHACAPTGAIMTVLALVTGSLWGRPTWGTYWVWDARLTSELILLFLYLGFIALGKAIEDTRRADKACALIAVVGVLNVPIIYFSVRWWNTLHQGASITARSASIETTMLVTIFLMVGAFFLYSVGVILARTRTIILEREKRAIWARNAAIKGML